MSQRPPISFRFTDQEFEVLEREQLQAESLSQTAARLLRERLGLVSVDNQSTLSKLTLELWIDSAVQEKLDYILNGCHEIVYKEVDKLNQRLEAVEIKLETKPRTTRKSTVKSTTVNNETTDSKIE